MSNPAIDAYRNTSFESAPPLKILRMLFAGAVRFLEQARDLDPEQDGPAFNERLGRVDAIVSELRCSLEPEHSPELAEQLDNLYVFVEGRINAAALDRDVEAIDEAIGVMDMLRAAWEELETGPADRADREVA